MFNDLKNSSLPFVGTIHTYSLKYIDMYIFKIMLKAMCVPFASLERFHILISEGIYFFI